MTEGFEIQNVNGNVVLSEQAIEAIKTLKKIELKAKKLEIERKEIENGRERSCKCY